VPDPTDTDATNTQKSVISCLGTPHAFWRAAMRNFKRVVVVRRGDVALFECLSERFANDPGTVVMYDRRRAVRAPAAMPGGTGRDRRESNRRWPQEANVLHERGFYVISRVQTALGGAMPLQRDEG